METVVNINELISVCRAAALINIGLTNHVYCGLTWIR